MHIYFLFESFKTIKISQIINFYQLKLYHGLYRDTELILGLNLYTVSKPRFERTERAVSHRQLKVKHKVDCLIHGY